MGPVRKAVLVLRRDFSVERASREGLVTVLPFVAAVVVLAGLAFGPQMQVLRATAAGTAWLAVLVAAVPLAQVLVGGERREDAWDLLRGLTTPGALFAGKTAATWLWLTGVWFLAQGLAVVLMGGRLSVTAVAGGVFGTLGVAVVTAVLALLTTAGTRRGGLLAVLLLPVSLPALLAGTETATVSGARWLVLLACYDALLLAVTWVVLPALMEE